MMAEDDYEYRLRKNRVLLVRDLLPESIADHLYSETIISLEESEIITNTHLTTAGKNRKLIDILATKGPAGYKVFRVALKDDFKWILDELDKTELPKTKTQKVETCEAHSTTQSKDDYGKVTDKMIDIVASGLLTSSSYKWKFIGRKLNIPEATLTEIEHRTQRDLRTQIYEMLHIWRQELSLSNSAYIPTQLNGTKRHTQTTPILQLVTVLQSEGMNSTAAKLEEMGRIKLIPVKKERRDPH